ncbi:MAG TPA: DUF4340 domain-containing protein [Terriglobales bacterium]|nr:DUF4340 domain-containing protein [Terriglobales bacterium]
MSRRGTVLLLLAVLLVGWLLWREGMPELAPPPVSPEEAEAPPLLAIDMEKVQGIVLRVGSESRSVERPAGGWVDLPQGKPVQGFLQEAKRLGRVQAIPAQPEELADFGLNPPEKVIELRFGGDESRLVEIGNSNPSTTGVYVRLDGRGEVILAGALLEWEFDKLWRALGSGAL